MQQAGQKKIVWLSNVFDHNYNAIRGEETVSCLSTNKRRDLFKSLELATGRQVVMLSAPPKSRFRRRGKWLPAVHTAFSDYPQFVCQNWDVPKLRIPLSWFFYARQALRHARRGDLVIIDNFEFIYIVAAWLLKFLRGVQFILDYEDGKHLSDRGWQRCMSWLAEFLGKPLISAAFLAHPKLGERLKPSLPRELVPGFVTSPRRKHRAGQAGIVRFLYSGSLDRTRGVDLLLAALSHLPKTGWHLDITGAGELSEELARAVAQPCFDGKIVFHQTLSADAFDDLLAECDVGLNCQRVSNPVSGVTFPSKVFTYLSAELLVLSSRASQVDQICGSACFYYDEESVVGLSAGMAHIMGDFVECRRSADREQARAVYSIEGTAARLRRLVTSASLI